MKNDPRVVEEWAPTVLATPALVLPTTAWSSAALATGTTTGGPLTRTRRDIPSKIIIASSYSLTGELPSAKDAMSGRPA